ncbi:MAG: inositol 2-dehydrogenase, partial [Chloroflexi bacterium]|nr:inositol 2-dehydrogenase [Chloroflexota bacterium]
GVADVVLSAAEQVAGEYGIAAYDDPRRLLEDPSVEAVVICTSTDTHAALIEAAAQAGKHIFCEKPIALDLAAIDRALAAVKATGVKLQIGFNRRFDANFQRARQAVAGGEIGQPHLLRITSRDPQPPPIPYIKVSGGIFLDMTIHDFDMARFLMGAEVEEIFAQGAVLVDPAIGEAGDVDTAIVTLRFANGALGTIDNSRRAVYGYDQRVEVFGSRGMIAVANETPHRATLSDATGVHGPLPEVFFIERYAAAYIAEMRAFVESVLEDKTPPVTGEDGRIPVVMGYAAWKSLRERRPVALNEITSNITE